MAGFQSAIDTLRRTESELEAQLASVRNAIAALGGRGAAAGSRRGPGRPRGGAPRKRRRMSAAARKRISDAQKARWAKQRAGK